MRSFSLLALAAAALAPFVGAAPAPIVDAAAGAVAGAAIHARGLGVGAGAAAGAKAGIHARGGVAVGAGAAAGAAVHARHVDAAAAAAAKGVVHARNDKKGVASILVELKVNLGVHIDALNCLKKETVTKEVIIPILKDIVSVIGVAVTDLKALVGADISVILCAADGTAQVAVSVIAQLLADVLILIFGALGFVLSIVSDVKIVIDVLVAVAFGDCICGLINAILALVDGLLSALVPLVLGLAGVILSLGLNVVGELLTIC